MLYYISGKLSPTSLDTVPSRGEGLQPHAQAIHAHKQAAASQQPCSASQPLQGCRQCEPWTAGARDSDRAAAWPNGLLMVPRYHGTRLRSLVVPSTNRSARQQLDQNLERPRSRHFYFVTIDKRLLLLYCTNVPLDS
jgi:hypothetical protein